MIRSPHLCCRYKKVPTFSEFVDYLVTTEVEVYNEHWLPYYLLCTPCHLNYTVIARTEDIRDDSRSVANTVELNSAANRSIGSTTGCTITEKAPTRAFSWLKAPTSAFTFKTLLRHYAIQVLTHSK